MSSWFVLLYSPIELYRCMLLSTMWVLNCFNIGLYRSISTPAPLCYINPENLVKRYISLCGVGTTKTMLSWVALTGFAGCVASVWAVLYIEERGNGVVVNRLKSLFCGLCCIYTTLDPLVAHAAPVYGCVAHVRT